MPVSSQALRRRAKKFLVRNPVQLFVQTLPGFEEVAAKELRDRGLRAESQHGGVALQGSLETVYIANLSSRTGNRVLLRLKEFLAQSYPMLYDRAREPDWAAILGNCPGYWIRVSASESRLRHAAHIRRVIHDAISNTLQSLGLDAKLDPDAGPTIYVRLYRDRCTLSLDTSGTHLHKRGYRTLTTDAPIRETIAAGLLILARSTEYDLVVDPFCGSGTFLIEADSLARRRPLGIDRRLAIEHSPLHSPGLLRHTRRQLMDEAKQDSGQRIHGFDISPSALEAARGNIALAGASTIRIARRDATKLMYSSLIGDGKRGLVIANLPYGRRLGTPARAEELLQDLLLQLARSARGWHFALISQLDIAGRHGDLVVEHTLKFKNGGRTVACHFGRIRE